MRASRLDFLEKEGENKEVEIRRKQKKLHKIPFDTAM
jgi:hypothetical protein